ncbi:MAG: tRNA epoxyqueuosine(34) reductase QueG [Pseudomonadota bacterium]
MTLKSGLNIDFSELAKQIKEWGRALGFAELGISKADVSNASPALMRWLALGRHGEMGYMSRHAHLRAAPEQLVPGTVSVISVRLPYWPENKDGGQNAQALAEAVLATPSRAYISRYALGRDYHKRLRKRLQNLAEKIQASLSDYAADELDDEARASLFSYRVFTDSAPVMEVELARQSGIAWTGKHTLALTRQGSWHFLGEIYTNLPLPADEVISAHCGDCQRCIEVCPTQAIVAPYQLDARRCISYLTIELKGSIPLELRPLIGNRIYGCDDCQLYCPWNRFAQQGDPDFANRNGLEQASLIDLFLWTEEEFLQRLAGSPIRRIGHEQWLRNIAVGLGNALRSTDTDSRPILKALKNRHALASPLVREHIDWAIAQSMSAAHTQ